MLIGVDYVNKTEGHMIGSEPPHEPFTDDVGKLYRFAVKEWGRCTGKVYIDDPETGKARQVGWVFLKRDRYTDTKETYLREVWVTLYDKPATVKRTEHYHFLDRKRERNGKPK